MATAVPTYPLGTTHDERRRGGEAGFVKNDGSICTINGKSIADRPAVCPINEGLLPLGRASPPPRSGEGEQENQAGSSSASS